ncbi:MAG: KTSC domain-containing protein [Propionicimonas sp.]
MIPKLHHVESSAIEKVGYEPSELTLVVMFKGGALYRYAGVPQHLYDQLLTAESKGSFVNRRIKPNFPVEPL